MPKPSKKKQPEKHNPPLKIEGDFLDVFKVVKKDKEKKQKKKS